MLKIKVDGEEFLELPLMGNVEIFIEDRLIWKTEKEPIEKITYSKGDKLRVKFISYQDYKAVYGINNDNAKQYNNTNLNVGDIVTFEGYSSYTSSCPTSGCWIFVEECDSSILDILCEKIN